MGQSQPHLRFEKKYKAELSGGTVSKGTQFEYAWCLVRSKYTDDIKKGIVLLEELVPKGCKEEQRDYVFYLAVANYRLKVGVCVGGMAAPQVPRSWAGLHKPVAGRGPVLAGFYGLCR
uniref:Mitochondrial fission 1 protein n=1 Tax=Terrapene triunguis TaxID=2587831 RepID=A0A674K1K1_9SAUR